MQEKYLLIRLEKSLQSSILYIIYIYIYIIIIIIIILNRLIRPYKGIGDFDP
jgi:hypothetical protein